MSAARGKSGGGRGGRTRLALLLSLWWVNSKSPYDSTRPASWWADLIGITDPDRGSRTVTANMHELARRRFVTIDAGDPGMPNTVTLLDAMGTGEPYVRPDGTTGPFFRVSEQLWTTGVIGELSGPALVMYLMMLYYYRLPTESAPIEGRRRVPSAPPVWFAVKGFRDSHGLSEDTRLAGIRALKEAGVIEVDSGSVDSSGAAGHRRLRRQLLTLTPKFEPPLRSAAPAATARILENWDDPRQNLISVPPRWLPSQARNAPVLGGRHPRRRRVRSGDGRCLAEPVAALLISSWTSRPPRSC